MVDDDGRFGASQSWAGGRGMHSSRGGATVKKGEVLYISSAARP